MINCTWCGATCGPQLRWTASLKPNYERASCPSCGNLVRRPVASPIFNEPATGGGIREYGEPYGTSNKQR